MKWMVLVCACVAWPAFADGMDTALAEPPVVPILREPSSDFSPLSATNGAAAGPSAAAQTGPTRIGGYPVRIAWDHVAVAAALLGGLYLMGSSTAAGSSN